MTRLQPTAASPNHTVISVSAVVNHGTTGLVFEDANGVIRFVTLTGVTESELTRD